MQNTLLQNKFNSDVMEAVEKSKKIGYNPTRFIVMLHKEKENAFEVAQKLVKKDLTFGLWELYKHRRLDLSLEAIITKPEYEKLFSPEIINTCKRKLKQLGYKIH